MKKFLEKDMAVFFGITQQGLINYKKHKDIEYKRRYEALKQFYIKYLEGVK